VQRRFRYQHAYGVIILVACLTKRLDYTALWCEQHEDFLAEVSDTLFDAYQIKSRKSELGPWKLNDESFYESIARFVELSTRFGVRIRRFRFVSNTEPFETNAEAQEHLCPLRLVACVATALTPESLDGPVKKGFKVLGEKAGVSPDDLFAVLKRFDFVLGPTLQAFEAEISQDHLGKLPLCSGMNPATLAKIRDALIAQVEGASSLYSDDPSRHYSAITRDYESDPLLLAKRILVADVLLTVNEASTPGFQYMPSMLTLRLGEAAKEMGTMEEKMARGGLRYHYEVMRRRAISAEQVLLELATRPDHGTQALSQLENTVLAECDDIRLRLSTHKEPYGVEMLIDVQDKLKRIAEEEPKRVYYQSAEVLIGIAGLLTSACKVWWSAPFQLESTS
jgi:hypothetical protein